MNSLWFNALVVGGALVLSFLLSGMEAGVLALNRLRIRQLMRAGDQRAALLHGFLDRPEDFLWTILIGNTLTNFVAVAVVGSQLIEALAGRPVWLVVALLAWMFWYYTFFELLPKMLFRLLPNRLTLSLARPFQIVHRLLAPLVAVVRAVSRGMQRWTEARAFTGHLFGTREEMRLVMQESAQDLTSEERQMINRVLDLQNLTVREIAIPLARVWSVPADAPLQAALTLAREHKVSRLPVWHQAPAGRRIAGILSLRPLLYQADLDPGRRAGDFLKPALYLEEGLRLEEALQRMRKSGERLAIVLGREQRETGILTLEDILKVIFGEVRL